MDSIVGKTIIGVRWLTAKEADALFGWEHRTEILLLDNGWALIASQDDEGNGPGALWGFNESEVRDEVIPEDTWDWADDNVDVVTFWDEAGPYE